MERINVREFVNMEVERISEKLDDLFNVVDKGTLPRKIAFIRVGEDPASISYMKSKSKQLTDVGFEVVDLIFEDNDNSNENYNMLANVIKDLNNDSSVLGMLIQSPVPHISKSSYQDLVNLIDPKKDLDAFGKESQAAQLATPFMKDKISISNWPCTPLGILYYLFRNNYDLAGKKVAIIGRSDIVGKPLATAMINSGAIVTIYNSNMPMSDINKELRTRGFNVIIGAIGKPGHIVLSRDPENPSAIDELDYVFDVGINRVKCEESKTGSILIGDIGYKVHPTDEYGQGLSATKFKFTPVPGGVGLLTRLGLILRAIRLISYNVYIGDLFED